MNPTMLNIRSFLKNNISSDPAESVKSAKQNHRFLSDMRNAMGALKKKSFRMSETVHRAKVSGNKRGFESYLESFRKRLLARGKPLNKIFLKEKDLPLLEVFLSQCGFSKESVGRIVKDLKEKNTGGEIDLSQFFLKVNEIGASEKKKGQTNIMESTAVLDLESILRNFGLSSKTLGDAFDAAKVEGEGVDLNRFIIKLKEINTHLPSTNKVITDQDAVEQIVHRMEKIGLHFDDHSKPGRVSINDVIASLEQVVEDRDKENPLPSKIKGTIDRILEKIAVTGQRPKPESFVKAGSSMGLSDSLSKEKMGENTGHVENVKTAPFSEDRKPVENKVTMSSLNEKRGVIDRAGRPYAESSPHGGKSGPDSDPGDRTGFKRPVQEAMYRIKPETGSVQISGNTSTIGFSEAVNTAEYGAKPSDHLPAYVIDQVGKQISRSILRGDRVVRLQLRPPELGMVQIKMDIKDHTLTLGMITEKNSAKDLLLSHVHELKEALVQQGVRLEKVDVQINSNFGQSLAGSKEGMNKGREWRRDFNSDEWSSNHQADGSHVQSINHLKKNSLLDLVA